MRPEAIGETRGSRVTIRGTGHRLVQNEPSCELGSPPSRDKLRLRQIDPYAL